MVATIYFNYDPAIAVFFPRCMFKWITGWDCAGCGSQRALHALLHGDIAMAWHYNRGLIVAAPLIVMYFYAEFRQEHCPRLYSRLNSRPVIAAVLVAVLLWWVLRNVFGV